MPDVIGEYEVEARWILALSQAEEDLQAGLQSAEKALQVACASGLLEQEADCRRVLGILRARVGDCVEAESLLRESTDICLQQNMPYGQGLALLELSRMYARLSADGDLDRSEWRGKALGASQNAADLFERLGAAHELRLARAVTSQLQAEQAAEAESLDGHLCLLAQVTAESGESRAYRHLAR
jgi:hypothetical protein